MSDKLILQLDKSIFDKILSLGIDLRKYVLKPARELTETEYLLSTEANRKALNKSIKNAKNRKNLIEVDINDI